jgi:hypothetical protein
MVSRPKGRYVAIGIAIGFTLFVAVLAFGVSIARFGNLESSSPSLPKNEYVENIASGIILIGVDTYEYREFEVPSDASNAIVRGSFHVFTDSAEQIRVLIFDQDQFLNWQTNQEMGKNHFYSGEVITADLEHGVPPGQKLYLVFDNTFSSTSAKSINADIELFYRR